jgi:hypothetical protein
MWPCYRRGMVFVLLIAVWITEPHAEEVQRRYRLQATLGPTPGEQLEMDLGWDWVHSHDDGTMVWQLAFDRVERDGTTHALEGHAVDLRRFGDGEVVEIAHAAHVMGGERALEAQDLLVGLMSPHVPSLGRKGSQAPKHSVWRLRGASGVRQETELETTWTNLGRVRRDGVACWHLRYEGTWRTVGHAMGWAVEGQGPVAGEVWLRRRDMVMEAHDFRWSRQVEVTRPAGSALQRGQAWVGSLVAHANAPERPGHPYLDLSMVQRELGLLNGILEACVEGTGWSTRTRITLDISQVGEARIQAGAMVGEPATCVRQALAGHNWPAHREERTVASFDLVVVEGRLRPVRGLAVVPRRPGWWFLEESPGTESKEASSAP